MPEDDKGKGSEGADADKKPGEGQGSSGGEGDQDKKPDKKEVSWEDFQKIQATNSRLLEESKSNKAELKKLRAAEEEKEKKRLEDEKKYPELIQKEKEKNKEISDRVLAQGIAFEIQRKCSDAVDIELISKLIKIDDKNLDSEKLEITDLAQQLDDIRKNKPYLFKAKGADMNQKIPTYSPGGEQKDLNKMSNDELGKSIGEGLVARIK